MFRGYHDGLALRGLLASFAARARARRMRQFVSMCGVDARSRVLDVGGGPAIWALVPPARRPRVVYVNMPRARADDEKAATLVFADGRALPFADTSFDIVFCNSVIEHVGDGASQRRLAEEIRRTGRTYWVQTPNRWFPIEQHLLTPLIHWLPRTWQRALVPKVNFWRWVARPRPDQEAFYYRHYFEDMLLLSESELARLFPDAQIVRERFLGWTKSVVALRNAAK
jgi:SAM-dependent methyltransferase